MDITTLKILAEFLGIIFIFALMGVISIICRQQKYFIIWIYSVIASGIFILSLIFLPALWDSLFQQLNLVS